MPSTSCDLSLLHLYRQVFTLFYQVPGTILNIIFVLTYLHIKSISFLRILNLFTYGIACVSHSCSFSKYLLHDHFNTSIKVLKLNFIEGKHQSEGKREHL